jgi:hypothetical protein
LIEGVIFRKSNSTRRCRCFVLLADNLGELPKCHYKKVIREKRYEAINKEFKEMQNQGVWDMITNEKVSDGRKSVLRRIHSSRETYTPVMNQESLGTS